jgi:superfamily II DNA/RNA helicase
MIAQSKNGTGKTGAFAVSSVLRVDPTIAALQVIVFANSREVVN